MLEPKKRKKSLALIILPTIVLLAGAYFIWTKKISISGLLKKTDSTKQENLNQSSLKDIPALPGQNNLVESEKNADSTNSQMNQDSFEEAAKKSDEPADEKLRQEIMGFIKNNLNDLVPPPKNDKWDSPSVSFVGNSHLYLFLTALETELAGIEILYDVQKEGNNFKLKEIARYKEQEDAWDLVSGNDLYGEYETDDYAYNEDTKAWEKEEYLDEEESTVDNPDADLVEENSTNEGNSVQKTIIP